MLPLSTDVGDAPDLRLHGLLERLPDSFIHKDSLRTIPLGLLYFQGAYVTEYRLLFAAIVISFVPTLLLYLVFQRRFIEGITVGAVRG